MSLDPARAAVRLAVRRYVGQEPRVVVACSGGADSLALLAATIFEGRREGVEVIGVTVDHGLQEGSAAQAAHVVAQMAAMGAAETATIRVTVDPGPAGIEAGAREARYVALTQLAESFGITTILLGHTLDDQAETVLLGLARGSGGRSLQGMRPGFESGGRIIARPLLGVTRAQTEAACRAEGVEWWDDPQNSDPRFARSRVRHTVMPLLERELGPGIAQALARTADQLRNDGEILEPVLRAAYSRMQVARGVDAAELILGGPRGIATAVIRRAALDAGVIESELTHAHVQAVLKILGRKGKEIQLPGHVTAYTEGDLLLFKPTEVP